MSRRTDKPAAPAAPESNDSDGPIVLSEKRVEVLIEAACHIQELMSAVSTLVDNEDDTDCLRAHMRTQALLAKSLARNISHALGDPAKFGWHALFMTVYGRPAEHMELGQ